VCHDPKNLRNTDVDTQKCPECIPVFADITQRLGRLKSMQIILKQTKCKLIQHFPLKKQAEENYICARN